MCERVYEERPEYGNHNNYLVGHEPTTRYVSSGENLHHSPAQRHGSVVYRDHQEPVRVVHGGHHTGETVVRNVRTSSPRHEVVVRKSVLGTQAHHQNPVYVEESHRQPQNVVYQTSHAPPLREYQPRVECVSDLQTSRVANHHSGKVVHPDDPCWVNFSQYPVYEHYGEKSHHVVGGEQVVESRVSAHHGNTVHGGKVTNVRVVRKDEHNNVLEEKNLENHEFHRFEGGLPNFQNESRVMHGGVVHGESRVMHGGVVHGESRVMHGGVVYGEPRVMHGGVVHGESRVMHGGVSHGNVVYGEPRVMHGGVSHGHGGVVYGEPRVMHGGVSHGGVVHGERRVVHQDVLHSDVVVHKNSKDSHHRVSQDNVVVHKK